MVFGATGTVGAYTCMYLAERGYEVIAVGHRKSDNGFFADYGGVEFDDEVHMPSHPFCDIFMSFDGVGVGAADLGFDDAAVTPFLV